MEKINIADYLPDPEEKNKEPLYKELAKDLLSLISKKIGNIETPSIEIIKQQIKILILAEKIFPLGIDLNKSNLLQKAVDFIAENIIKTPAFLHEFSKIPPKNFIKNVSDLLEKDTSKKNDLIKTVINKIIFEKSNIDEARKLISDLYKSSNHIQFFKIVLEFIFLEENEKINNIIQKLNKIDSDWTEKIITAFIKYPLIGENIDTISKFVLDLEKVNWQEMNNNLEIFFHFMEKRLYIHKPLKQ